ncbi:MAG: class I SAM-dependent methyltransferase [Gammaproteobacteria bacterium]|jgi:SAM-dependent methyltransferase
MLRKIKKATHFLVNTPFHPQWLIHGVKENFLQDVSRTIGGNVLDIGCSHKLTKEYLNGDVQYIGLDYFTAITLYDSSPDIFGNAENLLFLNNSIDAVFLLDVLEHIKNPGLCMQEITRVLTAGGKLIFNVPFMYPIHDAPYDYQRWTIYGLRNLLEQNNLSVAQEDSIGNSFETSGLLLNLAICKTIVTLLEKRHPGSIAIIILPLVIPIINIVAYISGKLIKSDNFMPCRYHLTAVKKFSKNL